MCVECIVVHKKPRECLNYARQAFDDSTALSSCVELCQALPTTPTIQSLRRVRPQSFRLQGSRGRAAAIRHPHGCFGQMRARQNAFKGSYIPGIEMPCIWV